MHEHIFDEHNLCFECDAPRRSRAAVALERLRVGQGLSLQGAAESVPTNRQTWHRWERGERTPTDTRDLARLVQLGVPLEWWHTFGDEG
jgi:DNA-binding transcriptional regulator YiaG